MWDLGWRQIAAIDAALADGVIDQRGWHEAMAGLLRVPYLTAKTPWEQSGKSGGEEDRVRTRKVVTEAVDRGGTFLDVGCANGYLMECVAIWAQEKGLDVEPHGVDIVPEFELKGRIEVPHEDPGGVRKLLWVDQS